MGADTPYNKEIYYLKSNASIGLHGLRPMDPMQVLAPTGLRPMDHDDDDV